MLWFVFIEACTSMTNGWYRTIAITLKLTGILGCAIPSNLAPESKTLLATNGCGCCVG